jgi:hypothetical protein
MNPQFLPPHFPQVFRLRQHHPAPSPIAIRETVIAGLAALQPRFPASGRIAVAVGSRGITQLPVFVEAILTSLRTAGLTPFIVPSMGSHGGGTPEGQTDILAGYGIGSANLAVELDPTMDTTVLGHIAGGVPVHTSTAALQADGIIVLNRIKPHTDFRGPVGSGLLKMLAVGLGKKNGATAFHIAASRRNPGEVVRDMARIILASAPILAGIAIVEDAQHQPVLIEIIPPGDFEATDARLLEEAACRMPRLPFDDIDLLIVDRLGKNISGTGMDPNVINRSVEGYSCALSHQAATPPTVRRIFVRELTAETHGNATGIGLADFTTRRLVESMDRRATSLNALTALNIHGAKIPIYFDTDAECIGHAIASLALPDPSAARIVRIRDTLSVADVEASAACLEETRRRPDLTVVSELAPMRLDEVGNLV